jgi:hypothetical protein
MIVTAGYLNKINTLLDGSVKLEIGTQEITPESAGQLFSIRGKYLKVILSEENVVSEALDEIKDLEITAPGKTKKSKSQILRAKIYRWWERKGKPGEFEEYYDRTMDVLIGHIDSKN